MKEPRVKAGLAASFTNLLIRGFLCASWFAAVRAGQSSRVGRVLTAAEMEKVASWYRVQVEPAVVFSLVPRLPSHGAHDVERAQTCSRDKQPNVPAE